MFLTTDPQASLGLMIFIWAVAFVIGITIQYVIAKKFESIARLKGYGREVHSFAMCFWLGFIGYFYVLALPKINTRAQMAAIRDQMAIQAGYAGQCPGCNATIPNGTAVCPYCHSELEWGKESDEDEDEAES